MTYISRINRGVKELPQWCNQSGDAGNDFIYQSSGGHDSEPAAAAARDPLNPH